jgi:serine/tyrosine/threonine adenylyltransferase
MSSLLAEKAAERARLIHLPFENSFVGALPADPVDTNVSRQVSNAAYTRVQPTAVAAPRLLAWSEAMGTLLGIERPATEGPDVDVLAGNRLAPGMQPYAARYGGHQFGHWAGQLGDGRAITLAERIGIDGRRYELQLKGAGQTPYSRRADGRAVLRSSLREFGCSEAMHWLGVPTTRALSLVATGEQVVRDMFYDGNPRPEPGAIVCRVSPSFVRFGNFQIFAAHGETELMQRLADYVIREHFQGLDVLAWYREICRRTAKLMVDWMRLGFVHGVMNTDNMSVLGLTIDYGPYGWLEGYDPMWTPNTTDAEGRRYCYGNQPYIAQWNLARLAEALSLLVSDQAALEEGLSLYADTFNAAWQDALARKLGFASLDPAKDDALTKGLFEALQETETDFTIFFRRLADVPLGPSEGESLGDDALLRPLQPAFYSPDAQHPKLLAWLKQYTARVREGGEPSEGRRARMLAANPKYVFRNYLAQLAIDALEKGDPSVLERTMQVLERPFDDQPGHDDLAARRPEWARHRAGCSALSCSS